MILYDLKLLDAQEHRRFTGADNEHILRELGYELARQRGSHEQWLKDGRTFTLACHGKEAPHYILDALRKLLEESNG